MALGNVPRRVIWLVAVAILLLTTSAMNTPKETAVIPDMTVYVGDTTAMPGATNTVISAFIDNNFDTVVGFSLWIQLDRPPDIMAFQTDSGISIDTTFWKCVTYSGGNCIDCVTVPRESTHQYITIDTFDIEIGNIDTTGTLISGWEYVNSRSLSGVGTDLLIVGIANLPGGPVHKGFAAQQGGRLIKILADIVNIDDTVSDRIVHLQINQDFKDNFNIVTSPAKNFWSYQYAPDTNGWVCTQWSIDTTQNPDETLGCLAYERTSTPPWDSIEIVPDSVIVLDTNKVKIYDGTLIVLPGYLCGDMNGDNAVGNILDLTFLVNRIFRGGPLSNPPMAMDLNCDHNNGNIIDLTKIVDRIFRGGPPLCNGGQCP